MVRKHYLVSGRVQGVGFRNFVHMRALELGIKGLVRNLDDGRVEVVAQGPQAAMTEFEHLISKGPSRASVESFEKLEPREKASEILDGSRGFAVAPDGEAPWSEKT